MAGEPGFLRAKKLKFYHGRAKIRGTGQLTLMPTGTLVASPGGALVFRTTPTFEASLIVDANASISGNLNLGGSLDVTGNSVFQGTASIDGDLTVMGDANLNGSLDVTGNASIDGALNVIGQLNTASRLVAQGNASFDGAVTLGSSLTVTGDADLNGSLDVEGNANFQGNVTLADKILTGVQGGNVMHAVKCSVGYGDFTAASKDEAIKIYRASAGDVIYDVNAYTHVGFKNGATATLLFAEIGDYADRNGFRLSVAVGSTHLTEWIWGDQLASDAVRSGNLGAYLWSASGAKIPKMYTAATNIRMKMDASWPHWVASLDTGSLDVFIHTVQNQ